MDCGTPIPAGAFDAEDEAEKKPAEPQDGAQTAAEEETAADVQSNVHSVGSSTDDGTGETLVFCPNCGMHMQKNPYRCDKCGSALADAPQGLGSGKSSVPLFNTEPSSLDGGYDSISDSDVARIDSFMNGGGVGGLGNDFGADDPSDLFGGGGISADDLSALTAQLANFRASSNDMPSIDAPAKPTTVRQKEPELGKERKVEDFAIDVDEPDESMAYMDNKVPVIDGCSMDEDPSADISLDPYKFLNNSMDDLTEPEPVPEPVAPVFEEPAPVAAAPVPEPITPVFEEPAPVAEEAPVPEPITPVFEEPAPVAEEAPVPEPITPVFEEPAPAAEEAPVPEPVAPIIEPIAPVEEETSVPEPIQPVEPVTPVEEAPKTEPAAPVIEPVVPAAAAAVAATATVAAAADAMEGFIPEEAPFIAEAAPTVGETAPKFEPQLTTAPTSTATDTAKPAAPSFPEPLDIKPSEPAPLRRPSDVIPKPDENAPKKGNLVYCRSCGQDMYDTEAFCKNCNAPYKGAYVPPKHAPSKQKTRTPKEPIKLFGVIPLPTAIGLSAVVVGIIILAIYVKVSTLPAKPPISGETSNSSTSTSSTVPSTPDESSVSEPVDSTTSSSSSSDVSSSEPDSSTESSSESSSSSSSSSSTKSSSSSKSSSKSSSSAVVGQAKINSLESDRTNIMNAAASIAGEVGKIEALAQHVNHAMSISSESDSAARTTFYNTNFAKTMLNSINSGKVTVDALVNSAAPKNSELNAQYQALNTLKSRYTSYYNYIKNPTGNATQFSNNCTSYYNNFTSALSQLSFNKFMINGYSDANKNSAYSSTLRTAARDIKSSVNYLTTLRTSMVNLGSRFGSSAMDTLANNANYYANAAAYTMRVNAYGIMLSGASNNYSSYATNLTHAYSAMWDSIKSYALIEHNTLNSYSTTSNNAISNATTYANRITAAVGN